MLGQVNLLLFTEQPITVVVSYIAEFIANKCDG